MVQGYQMDLFYLDESQIHFSYSTSTNHYWSLTCVRYKNLFFAFSISNENSIFQLWHTKHWVVFWASIYNWNCDKASFSKRSRRGMINVQKDEVETSSLYHCIYIFVKQLMHSRSIRNLSVSIVIAFNHLGLFLRYSM